MGLDCQGQETREMWVLHGANGKVDVGYQGQKREQDPQEEKSRDLVH